MQIPVDEELIHYWYTFVYTVYTIIMIMIVFVYMIIIITSWRLIDLRKSYDIIVAIKNFKLHVLYVNIKQNGTELLLIIQLTSSVICVPCACVTPTNCPRLLGDYNSNNNNNDNNNNNNIYLAKWGVKCWV